MNLLLYKPTHLIDRNRESPDVRGWYSHQTSCPSFDQHSLKQRWATQKTKTKIPPKPDQNKKPTKHIINNEEYFLKQLTGPSLSSLPGSEFWELQKIVLNKEVPLLNQVLPIILPDLTFFYLTAPFLWHCGLHSAFQHQPAVQGVAKLHWTSGYTCSWTSFTPPSAKL